MFTPCAQINQHTLELFNKCITVMETFGFMYISVMYIRWVCNQNIYMNNFVPVSKYLYDKHNRLAIDWQYDTISCNNGKETKITSYWRQCSAGVMNYWLLWSNESCINHHDFQHCVDNQYVQMVC